MPSLTKIFLPFLFLLLVVTGVFHACNEVDVRLVNQVKTFGPKWTSLGEKLAFADRNLQLMENRFEADYNELKPLFSQIPDSLGGKHLWRLIGKYKGIMAERDTIRQNFELQKSLFTESVNAFNEWEKKVMDNDLSTGIATSELTKFKQTYAGIETSIDTDTKTLYQLADQHNSILRKLTEKLNVYTNYDIALK